MEIAVLQTGFGEYYTTKVIETFYPSTIPHLRRSTASTLVELGSLVLEHRLLSPHDGQPLVARRRAAALQLHVILDASIDRPLFRSASTKYS